MRKKRQSMVWVEPKDGIVPSHDYKRISRSQATEKQIIRCSMPNCDLAAYNLDCLYPYHHELTLCRKHWDGK